MATQPTRENAAPCVWPDDATRDRLIGDWFLYQRRRGHRTSTDDVLTAWFASVAVADTPRQYVDLGCGIGSVLLMTAHRLRPARSIGVEAQAQSAMMARRTVSELPPDGPRIDIVEGDFREVTVDAGADLVTGSPPYFPVGTGILSPDPQRAACRFELRGGIEAYCERAASLLAPAGRFVCVFQSAFDGRVIEAATEAGLSLIRRGDVAMRAGGEPFLSVYAFAHAAAAAAREEDVAFAIRGADGEITPAYRRAREALGVD